ncbi:MAG: hypothetical protein ABJG41_08650 [Cyclobacteriaceae bacterium]
MQSLSTTLAYFILIMGLLAAISCKDPKEVDQRTFIEILVDEYRNRELTITAGEDTYSFDQSFYPGFVNINSEILSGGNNNYLLGMTYDSGFGQTYGFIAGMTRPEDFGTYPLSFLQGSVDAYFNPYNYNNDYLIENCEPISYERNGQIKIAQYEDGFEFEIISDMVQYNKNYEVVNCNSIPVHIKGRFYN